MSDLNPDMMVEALRQMLTRSKHPGAQCQFDLLLNVWKKLEFHNGNISRVDYESERDRQIESIESNKTTSTGIERKQDLIDTHFIGRKDRKKGNVRRPDWGLHLLHEDGDNLRLSTRNDMQVGNPAKLSGLEIPRSSDENTLRSRIAHNYLLTYPERLAMAIRFGQAPASKESVLRPLADTFLVHRKINDAIVDTVWTELRILEVVSGEAKGAVLSPSPPAPICAARAADAMLQEGAGKLDVQLEYDDVVRHWRRHLPADLLIGSWRNHVGTDGAAILAEAGNEYLRLTHESFCHLLACGMVDPQWAYRVFDAHGEGAELSRLDEVRTAFGMDDWQPG